MLEDENEHMTENLSNKISALKSVSSYRALTAQRWVVCLFITLQLQLTIDIGHEVRSQNKMLSEMVSCCISPLPRSDGGLVGIEIAENGHWVCNLSFYDILEGEWFGRDRCMLEPKRNDGH